MASFPLLNERELDLLVSYPISSDEEMSVAVVDAFHAANIDVLERPTQLVDWVDIELFENIQWASDCLVYLSTCIWGHRVVITAEEPDLYVGESRTSWRVNRLGA